VENNLVFWDIKAYKPTFILNVGEEKIQDFEVCKDKITISTGEVKKIKKLRKNLFHRN